MTLALRRPVGERRYRARACNSGGFHKLSYGAPTHDGADGRFEVVCGIISPSDGSDTPLQRHILDSAEVGRPSWGRGLGAA